jgi:hypothetical protein
MTPHLGRRLNAVFVQGEIRTKLLGICGILLMFLALGMAVAALLFRLSPSEALWWAWTHLLDAGFIGDDKDSLAKAVLGSFFALLGLLLLGGAFITLSEEAAKRALNRLMGGAVPTGLRGHTIIAGKGPKLIAAVTAARNLTDSKENTGTLVLVLPDQAALAEAREACGRDAAVYLTVDKIWETCADRLGMGHAARIILLDNFGGDSGAMMQTILSVVKGRKEMENKKELRIYAEVNNLSLANGLRGVADSLDGKDEKTDIHIQNITDASARLALKKHPLDCERVGPSNPVVLIIDGWTPFAQALFWQAIRVGHYAVKPTRIVVVHPDAERISRDVRTKAPGLWEPWCIAELVDVQFVQTLDSETFTPASDHSVTLAVCDGNPDKAVSNALFHQEKRMNGLRQILVELPDLSGYRKVFEAINTDERKTPLYPVGDGAEAFELWEKLDEVAKALHEQYLAQRQKEADWRKMDENGRFKEPSDHDWKDLDEVRRSWNRASADHIEVKLRALADIDFHKVTGRPRYSPDAGQITDATLHPRMRKIIDAGPESGRADLELLAKIEHDRWCGEKFAQGWVYSQTKDKIKKRSPDLTPYNRLNENTKRYDREAVVEVLKFRIRLI